MRSLIFGPAPSLTGTWTADLSGSSVGTANLDLKDEEGRILGHCKLTDAHGGSFDYDVQGVLRTDAYTLVLSPKSGQVGGIGTVGARCRFTDAGELIGTWNTGTGQTGAFATSRATDSAIKQRPTGSAVFLVHGHDEGCKEKVARFLEKLGLQVLVLHEMVSRGLIIIEKFEDCAGQAGFAVVLATPDDIGYPINEEEAAGTPECGARARLLRGQAIPQSGVCALQRESRVAVGCSWPGLPRVRQRRWLAFGSGMRAEARRV
jgi:hypothetical protein